MLPVELSCRQQQAQAELLLRVDADLFWFRGHFPQQPLLPGVAQLDWVMHYGTQLLAAGKQFSSIENIKFQQPVLPDSTLKLALTWNALKNQLSFRYLLQQGECESVASSGKINLC
ncbi:hydroxymyristoyl-ACP dehydratase [Erwiniaceae bacterium BAC15a-03b]|uniref:Hydroxymyristoyl-ACP dehydratase n=1 Tax=Winslowiella arboricola TaxID=2978220 RepID=A0A9J6PPL9_9GAMM|nr:hydroxymyristoyl-ACP dehydratase [Winslowiella arboricola]MCU5775354.1 hydroxymyristoyl-ACP dehydratase [Winslowiella arboricola]MCU5780249.1 hydroxymyristoyl-ACP dehydratase [Winslowiella arboricola]